MPGGAGHHLHDVPHCHLLKPGGDIGGRVAFLQGPGHRRFEAREAESKPFLALERRCQRHLAGIALPGQSLDLRPARIAQAQKPRGLVESLTGGVVQGGPQEPVGAPGGHLEQVGVAAGGDQGQERRFDLGVFGQRGVDVALGWCTGTKGLPRAKASPLP